MQNPSDLADRVDHARSLLSQMRLFSEPAPKATRQVLERLKSKGPIKKTSSKTLSHPDAKASPDASSPSQKEATQSQGDSFSTASLSKEERKARLAALREEVLVCTKCPHLVASRTNVVFGEGNPDADLMFIGEAPGADEDAQGKPFVGRAGQLLTKIIEAMGLRRDEIYIANILKCRPDMPDGKSGNRKPRPEEMATCIPWLKQQIALIQPKALVALGATAAEGLLGGGPLVMRDMRSRWHAFEQIPVMVTYHPAYLLRNQSLSEKRKVWEDMLLVMEHLRIPISKKQRSFFLSK